jgi:hypothetical protein
MEISHEHFGEKLEEMKVSKGMKNEHFGIGDGNFS